MSDHDLDAKAGKERFQTFRLTEFEGAPINVDVRAVGSAEHPEFQLRLRVGSIKVEVTAAALEDIVVQDQPEWEHTIELLTVAEIKAYLQEFGAGDEIRGKTKKADLLESLRSCLKLRQPGPRRVAARAGDQGKVVQPLHKDENGHLRIGVAFQEGSVIHVLLKQVKLSDPVHTFGEHRLGKGSAFVLTAGYLAFRKGSQETTFLLDGGQWKPAAPGPLTEWCKPFPNSDPEKVVFSMTDSGQCQLDAKLKLVCGIKSEQHASQVDDADVETPEMKRPRLA